MTRRIGIALLLLVTSCASLTDSRAKPPGSPEEIYYNPHILFDSTVPRERMALWGVHLGDPESAIAKARILDTGKEGWIKCWDGSRYRVQEGVVVTLGVWDPKVIEKLNIETPPQIEARFGKPDKIDAAEPVMIYRYVGGKISVLWNRMEEQVNAVNVSR